MYLKAIELQGFKSFPEKTRLEFEKAVTAIVGPNGSGKSNLSDAIAWVLGEQSTKALRGSKMEDVIFGGTAKRPQMGVAEVSLFLDNSDRSLSYDADEIQVTRRYYRSGESEYYVNRNAVRLKDLNELFMDTGLGRDGYSIIGQGKIDSILSAKSTDRREVFEEAAGISRYRYRKEDSERKLEHAEEDLTRVGDKISELELQVEPLRKQSETAKRYLVLRDELRSLEISLWLSDLDAAGEKRKKLEEDAIAVSGDTERVRGELETLYASGEAISGKMREKDVEAEQIRAAASEEEAKAAAAESEAAVLRTELGHNESDIARIGEELKLQESRDSGLHAQIGERKTRIDALRGETAEADASFASLEERSRALAETESAAEAKLLALERKNEETAARLAEARTELSSLAASIQASDDRDAALVTEINAGAARLEEAKTAQAENLAAAAKAEEDAAAARNVAKGHELRAQSRRQKAEETAASKSRLDMDLGTLRSRKQMLAEMEKEHAGFSQAVKAVMREASRGTLRGIHGAAGELIRTSGRFALAVETAMGPAMQDVIVSTEEDGKAAIGFLKRQDAGRVTFLPMSVIRGRGLDAPGIEDEEGFEGVASGLVTYDEKYRNIYENLLGRTAVASDMDSAIRIARKYRHSFRIVTLDGQVLNAGGSMTGGSASKGSGILSRASELSALAEREGELSEKAAGAGRAAAEAKRALDAEEYELSVAKDELRAAEDAALRLGAEKEQRAALVAALSERAEQLRSEAAAVREKTAELAGALAGKKKDIAALETAAEGLRKELDEAANGRTGLSEARRALLAAQAGIKEKKASLDAEIRAQEQAVAELETLRSELSGGRGQKDATLAALKNKNEDIIREIAARELRISQLRAAVGARRERIAAIAEEKLALEGERTRRDRETKDKNDRLLELERESARIEQRRQASEMEEKQIVDRLWDNYELTRTAAMEQRTELQSIPAAKRRTGELRREMTSLGTPNLGAIEEYQRVNERYTYLTGQRDDIEKARTELLSIISDITEQMRTLFSAEFSRISARFSQTFTELFGGGAASLELEDPNDILECGVEIRVQPPGKTLRTLTLLSGGEKAFVAIALYFAIIQVRPTPFVVMDEIEAALDEANVTKMSGYMRKLSDKTQFLVITHRRGTMEDADVLYGVTMQEQGVSRVLKVDLDEAERTIKQKKK